MTPEDEERVRELIDEDYWEGFKTRFIFWVTVAVMAHFTWSGRRAVGAVQAPTRHPLRPTATVIASPYTVCHPVHHPSP